MKKYVSPEMTAVELEKVDVICTSSPTGGLEDGGAGGGMGEIVFPDTTNQSYFG